MPFSLPSPPSLCRGKAGEKEKKKQESARSMMGREKRTRAISIYIYIYFWLFYWDTQRSLCEGERSRMVRKFGAWDVGRPLSSPTLSEV